MRGDNLINYMLDRSSMRVRKELMFMFDIANIIAGNRVDFFILAEEHSL